MLVMGILLHTRRVLYNKTQMLRVWVTELF